MSTDEKTVPNDVPSTKGGRGAGDHSDSEDVFFSGDEEDSGNGHGDKGKGKEGGGRGGRGMMAGSALHGDQEHQHVEEQEEEEEIEEILTEEALKVQFPSQFDSPRTGGPLNSSSLLFFLGGRYTRRGCSR